MSNTSGLGQDNSFLTSYYHVIKEKDIEKTNQSSSSNPTKQQQQSMVVTTQRSIFSGYNKNNQIDRKIKENAVRVAQEVMTKIVELTTPFNKDQKSTDKATKLLKTHAANIQNNMNGSGLTREDLETYKQQTNDLCIKNDQYDYYNNQHGVNYYIDIFHLCCIIAAKHDIGPDDNTKRNWLPLGNTSSIKSILSNTQHSNEHSGSNLKTIIQTKIVPNFLPLFPHGMFNLSNSIPFNVDDEKNTLATNTKNQDYTTNMNGKFVFKYNLGTNTKWEKFKEEDKYALKVMQSKVIVDNITLFAQQLADTLEVLIKPEEINDYIYKFNEILCFYFKGAYPIPITSCKETQKWGVYQTETEVPFPKFEDLLDFLRKNDNLAQLLSIIYLLFKRQPDIFGIKTTEVAITKKNVVDDVYDTVIKKQQKNNMPTLLGTHSLVYSDNRFGNSGQIQSDGIFSSKHFYRFTREIDRVELDKDRSNHHPETTKLLNKGYPYISGISGMANLFCKVLYIMHIHPYSEKGRYLCEAMAAFIVGSGEHSYYEVYRSFNLYAERCLDYPEDL